MKQIDEEQAEGCLDSEFFEVLDDCHCDKLKQQIKELEKKNEALW